MPAGAGPPGAAGAFHAAPQLPALPAPPSPASVRGGSPRWGRGPWNRGAISPDAPLSNLVAPAKTPFPHKVTT